MSEKFRLPRIDTRYICIVDRGAVSIAAIISSYLYLPGFYIPIFLFPTVKHPQTEEATKMTDSYMSNLMGGEASILINNAWARIGGSERVILAGLTEHQKSYLHLPTGTKVIEITDPLDIQQKLSPIAPSPREELRCKSSDILKALLLAQRHEKKLVIDESAEALPELARSRKGIVVVERVADTSPVVAINYASAVNADTLLVDPLPDHVGRSVPNWIRGWKEDGDSALFEKLMDAIYQRIGKTSFSEFEYATFFTEGLPYSLALRNSLPCSHVHLTLKPDLFVINNLIFETASTFHSAIVFSPVFFPDEETNWLCDFLSHSNYYLRRLVGGDATLVNFDFHAQFFPYDILHICSHGGEVTGYEMAECFVDEDGKTHTVEFDEVVGFTPVPDDKGRVEVHTKAFPRKLDGFEWMSHELQAQNLPRHVYTEMWKTIMESRGRRKPKSRIPMSCSIACIDSIHQGQFHTLASHSSPFVFNNACWSWGEVAHFFLACGARGYIGTLWAVDNDAAVIAAKTFYSNAFSEPILAAFHKAIKAIDETDSKDIYIY